MIRQQINLYQDRFREPRVVLSAAQSLTLFVLTLAIIGFGSYHIDQQLAEQQQINAAQTQAKQQIEQQLAQNRKLLNDALADTQIDEELHSLLRDIDSRRRLISFVENNSLGSGRGFSQRLEALSNLGFKDVWLNEIALQDQFVKLSGSALHAEQIPDYFHAFRQRNLFQGNAFDIFELKRDPEREWKVDFVIASRAKRDE